MTCPWCISEGDLFLGGKCPKCFRKEKDMNETATKIYQEAEKKAEGIIPRVRLSDLQQICSQPHTPEMTASELVEKLKEWCELDLHPDKRGSLQAGDKAGAKLSAWNLFLYAESLLPPEQTDEVKL
jgi:hypothetical protein